MLSKRIPVFLFLLLVFFAKLQAFTADDILGRWYNQEKTAQINIYKNSSGKYMGTICWLKEPLDSLTGKPKLDKENSDKTLRSTPLLGLMVLKNFVFDQTAQKYADGTIYDPKNGSTYTCKITMINVNELDVRGYVMFSFIGRTAHWTRAK